jgi:hypothetical protein
LEASADGAATFLLERVPAEYATDVLLEEHIVQQALLLGLELLVALLELQLLLHHAPQLRTLAPILIH